ncbi:ABC transporter substrate-binding protein [Sulfitobacter aestuariivivens]
MDRRALFASAAAATLLAATGVSAAGFPKSGGRLRMALSGADRSDTWGCGDGLFMQVARQGLVFDTLTEISADGTLRGELATSWTPSEDARVWHFDLRRDATFHDGTLFTAADVVASAAGFAEGSVQAIGSHQVMFTLHTPDAALPMRLADPAFYISAAHAMGSGIGTGLYRVKHFAPGQQVLTKRVVDHYKGETAGWFDEVELVSIPAASVRAQALAEGLIDAADLKSVENTDVIPTLYRHDTDTAFSTDLALPKQVGTARPLDNLRAAERWWFA